ncbi:Uncharacterised protein [Mycolicibacterium flavescens]|nr:Uncharacterised protein [Mycolicibacterium flavescens]
MLRERPCLYRNTPVRTVIRGRSQRDERPLDVAVSAQSAAAFGLSGGQRPSTTANSKCQISLA